MGGPASADRAARHDNPEVPLPAGAPGRPVEASAIAAPGWTRKAGKARDLPMYHTRQGKQWRRHEGPYWRGPCQWPGACSDGHIGERRQHDGSGPFDRSLPKRSGVAQPAEGEDKGPVRTEAPDARPGGAPVSGDQAPIRLPEARYRA